MINYYHLVNIILKKFEIQFILFLLNIYNGEVQN